MNLLFSAYNITTKMYLEVVAKKFKVLVFQNKKSRISRPTEVDVVPIEHAFEWLQYVMSLLKVDRVRPEYVINLRFHLNRITPNLLVVVDFYNLTFQQFLKYKKRNPEVKLYVWSETRQWPSFWLTRWVMYGFWWYFKRNVQHVEKVFVFTEKGRQFFHIHAPAVAVEVLPAPVDVAQFYPAEQKNWLPHGQLRVLMNARFVALKEHRTLFAAVAKLEDSGVSVVVSLIGRGGHLQEELMAYAVELGIREQITLLEPVAPEQLREIYTAHDVLVLPSNREAIGMVVPEAMACGLPTITSEAVGANTYVKEGETGFIFETGNAAQLAEKLQLLNNKDTAAQMGAAAAQEIREHYSVEVLGKKLETILAADERA